MKHFHKHLTIPFIAIGLFILSVLALHSAARSETTKQQKAIPCSDIADFQAISEEFGLQQIIGGDSETGNVKIYIDNDGDMWVVEFVDSLKMACRLVLVNKVELEVKKKVSPKPKVDSSFRD
jgi:hypothetical protein